MHMFYGASGFGFLQMLIPMLIWLAVVMGMIHLVSRWFGGQRKFPKEEYLQPNADNSSIELLNRRYASGELTTEEYISMREEIRGY
ncbi:MAG: hypothetical protein FH756_04715 [Firmicutes bacterium]|nr:hypothetical protein [Bacillota bacterium]